MGYRYKDERPKFFTNSGNTTLEEVRGLAANHLKAQSSVMIDDAIRKVFADNWLVIACFDRLVELGELEEYDNPDSTAGQHRIFTRPSWHKTPGMEGGENFFLRKLLFTGSADSRNEMREMLITSQNRD